MVFTAKINGYAYPRDSGAHYITVTTTLLKIILFGVKIWSLYLFFAFLIKSSSLETSISFSSLIRASNDSSKPTHCCFPSLFPCSKLGFNSTSNFLVKFCHFKREERERELNSVCLVFSLFIYLIWFVF